MKPPELQIILLAAGLSSRMGQENKLLLPYHGTPIVRHVAKTIISANIGQLNIVTGFQANEVAEALKGLRFNLIHNPDYNNGQMSTVKTAYQNLPNPHADIMVALGDMPQLTKQDYQAMVQNFAAQGRQKIIIPYFGEDRGNPIITPAKFNAEIREGSMNAGCRSLTSKRSNDVVKIPVTSASYIADIDTPSDYSDVITDQMIFPICC